MRAPSTACYITVKFEACHPGPRDRNDLRGMISMLKRFLRSSTTASFRAALRKLPEEWKIMRTHKDGVRKASSVEVPCSLHIGCGPNRKPGWVNIDLSEGADVRLDLRESLPFPDNSAKIIYSEHFFEHLDFAEGTRFLRDSMRVLQPGGRMSIGVPDARLIMDLYTGGDRDVWMKVRDRWHPKWCTTPMHSVNYFFRQDGEHKYAYDAETLTTLLKECGFSNIHERQWDSTLDSELRRQGTLYIDAEKP